MPAGPSRRTVSACAERLRFASGESGAVRVSASTSALTRAGMPAHQREGRVAAHRQPADDRLREAEVVEQRDRVVGDPLHGQEPVAGRRAAEAAGVEAHDLVRRRESARTCASHILEVSGKACRNSTGGPGAADVVVELRARDGGLHRALRARPCGQALLGHAVRHAVGRARLPRGPAATARTAAGRYRGCAPPRPPRRSRPSRTARSSRPPAFTR